MKMWKTLLALVLCLALALPCALAEDAYTPGETMRSLFAEAWSKGQMITADLSLQVALNGDVLGLTQEDMAQVDALTALLDTATLRMGAVRIDGGVRVLLAGLIDAQEGAEDVYVDVAADITRTGLSLESSLLEGRRVTASWNTLLQLCGLSTSEAEMVVSLLEMDWNDVIGQLMPLVETYGTMAMEMLEPYGETVVSWAQTLTIEQMTDVEATEDYPAVATLVDVYVTEKDLGALVKALADQLAQDEALCSLLDEVIPELTDESYPGTAALCAQLSEASASLTDEEYPVILSLAMDEEGTPLYVEFYNAVADGTAQYAGLFYYPDAADPALYNYELSALSVGIDGNAEDGFMLYGTMKGDEADPLFAELTSNLAIVADREYVMGFSYEANTASAKTAEGLPGMTTSAEMALSMEDDADSVTIIANVEGTSGMTSRGGEQSDAVETIDMYVGDEAISVTALVTTIVEPGENGLTGSYSILESMPDMGIDRYGIQILLNSADYVPATLTEVAFETLGDEEANALVSDVTNSASALLEKVLQAYPEDTVQLLMELAEEL